MPELPEVETVRKGLEAALTDAVIKKVTLRRKDLRIPLPGRITTCLSGRTIKTVQRRAKYLLFAFDSEDILIAHLGMTGRFSVEPGKPEHFKPHDHVVFDLADGRTMIYNDTRRFGLIDHCLRPELASHPLLASLGPEPFDKNFSTSYLKEALQKRTGPIKTALMDNALVVGVGNIYANEALYLAGIHPPVKLPPRPPGWSLLSEKYWGMRWLPAAPRCVIFSMYLEILDIFSIISMSMTGKESPATAAKNPFKVSGFPIVPPTSAAIARNNLLL